MRLVLLSGGQAMVLEHSQKRDREKYERQRFQLHRSVWASKSKLDTTTQQTKPRKLESADHTTQRPKMGTRNTITVPLGPLLRRFFSLIASSLGPWPSKSQPCRSVFWRSRLSSLPSRRCEVTRVDRGMFICLLPCWYVYFVRWSRCTALVVFESFGGPHLFRSVRFSSLAWYPLGSTIFLPRTWRRGGNAVSALPPGAWETRPLSFVVGGWSMPAWV